MYLSPLLLFLSFGSPLKYAAGSEWCYTGCDHTPSHWVDLPGSFCGATRQSPVDIITSHVETDSHLHNFTFTNFSSRHVIKSFANNGHTVKFTLEKNEVEVSGGGLNDTYSTIQFHFHWGDTEHHPGSEHMVDGHRYPMEMHIVSLKKGLSVEQAKSDPRGIAALGFFINATENETMSEPWKLLTSYIMNATATEQNMTGHISIQELIGDVDLTKFYRYMGSLTTPSCNEAVVWTVFQEPINVAKSLVQKFAMETGLVNIYRPNQPLHGRRVFASPATPLPPSHPWCYDGHCAFNPSHWHLLPHSYCGDERQSPVNIDTKNTATDENLVAFTFTEFGNKHAIKYITNTGHTVKCVLKEDLVEVSGGGLGHVYSTLQFHFHWGSSSHDSKGSEHMVDSKRYPMEMHLVNKRKDLTLQEAIKTPNGLAVLGFFIEATDDNERSSGSAHAEASDPPPAASNMQYWEKLTSYLSAIQNISSQTNVTKEISIDDLLGNVDRTSYYRYNGSLTTPTCNEAVVWTVFKESIRVDQNLMMMFPTQTGYTDVFRPAQRLHGRTVFTTAASRAPQPTTVCLLLAVFSGLLM